MDTMSAVNMPAATLHARHLQSDQQASSGLKIGGNGNSSRRRHLFGLFPGLDSKKCLDSKGDARATMMFDDPLECTFSEISCSKQKEERDALCCEQCGQLTSSSTLESVLANSALPTKVDRADAVLDVLCNRSLKHGKSVVVNNSNTEIDLGSADIRFLTKSDSVSILEVLRATFPHSIKYQRKDVHCGTLFPPLSRIKSTLHRDIPLDMTVALECVNVSPSKGTGVTMPQLDIGASETEIKTTTSVLDPKPVFELRTPTFPCKNDKPKRRAQIDPIDTSDETSLSTRQSNKSNACVLSADIHSMSKDQLRNLVLQETLREPVHKTHVNRKIREHIQSKNVIPTLICVHKQYEIHEDDAWQKHKRSTAKQQLRRLRVKQRALEVQRVLLEFHRIGVIHTDSPNHHNDSNNIMDEEEHWMKGLAMLEAQVEALREEVWSSQRQVHKKTEKRTAPRIVRSYSFSTSVSSLAADAESNYCKTSQYFNLE